MQGRAWALEQIINDLTDNYADKVSLSGTINHGVKFQFTVDELAEEYNELCGENLQDKWTYNADEDCLERN